MSRRQDILRAVMERPGMQLREIAAAIGFKPGDKITAVSAQLTHLCDFGLLRNNGLLRGKSFYPNENTQAAIDRKPGSGAKPGPKPKPAKPAAKKRYASPLAREPKPASKIAIGVHAPKPPPPPRAAAHPAGAFETVDEFLARGGKVQRLPNGASAHPLHTITPAEINERNWQRKQRAIDDL